jgi:hypothetical protein
MIHGAKTLFAVLPAIFLFLSPVSAQDATGAVSGTVLCNDGNTPARGAKIELIPLEQLLNQSAAVGSKSTNSDFTGTYEMRSLTPGTYIVNATLDGYDDDLKLVRSAADAFSPEDKKKLFESFPQVIIKPGASTRKDLLLRRAAAISGRVAVDMGGTPGRVLVTATRIFVHEASSSLVTLSEKVLPFEQSTVSDDRGAFRIAGLPAGMYRVSLRITEAYFAAGFENGKVHLQPERPGTAELIVFAPEALDDSNARIISVNDGDEITDADITVPTRILHSIAGTVTERGAPASSVTITLERKGGSMLDCSAISMPDGSYRFDLLPSGSYILRAKDTVSSSAGETFVQILDSDVLDSNIDLHGPESPTH